MSNAIPFPDKRRAKSKRDVLQPSTIAQSYDNISKHVEEMTAMLHYLTSVNTEDVSPKARRAMEMSFINLGICMDRFKR